MKYTFVKYDQLCHSERSNEIAKSKNLKVGLRAVLFATIFLAACGDDNKNAGGTVEDGEVVAIVDKTVSGVSQKGPFVNGSSVTVQELDGETLAQTGVGFEGKIKNDMGEFSVKVNRLESQYALLKANGFYRNEVTGEKSKSQVTLYALTDLSNRDEVNVNLLTHMAYERSLYLATGKDSMSVASAKKQAESEVFKSFGIEGNFATAEDLNIFGESDQSAALLAVSILMQSDLSEGDFSERLADYAADIEADGVWNDSKTATKIADWANTQWLGSGLTKIRENITKWELSTDVPEFEKYVNNFWWQNYGLGTCDKKREGEVLKNQNKASVNADEYYICKSKLWQVASDIEKDTYKWLDPTAKRTEKDGDVRYGDVVKTNCYVFEDKTWRSGNASDCSLDLRGCTKLRQDTVGKASDKVWYICNAKTWRDATTYEKDTFGWKVSTDGAIKKGNVTDTVYVFDKTAWRVASAVEGKLGGCVDAITDSVSKVESVYYICKSRKWLDAGALEYDTYKWAAGKDGDSKYGSVNTEKCYVFEDKAWRSGNANDCSLKLRGCTALRQDTVALGSDKVWHICDSKSWRNATTYEKDTFGWKDSTDGSIKKGNVTDTVYVFDKTAWRVTSAVEGKLGGCVSAIADSVGKVGTIYYICKSNKWVEASALEYDTYKWTAGVNGDIRVGQVNTTVYYIYEANLNAWRNATTIEKDTYDYKNSKDWIDGVDGQIQKGAVTDTIYVFDKTSWRVADDIEKILGGCVPAIFDSVGKVNDSYYACSAEKWEMATELQYDTYRNECAEFGQIIHGNVNVDFAYFCYGGYWKRLYGNESVPYGKLVDERDGKIYRTVKIGNQIWMAENLNYNDPKFGNNSIWCMSNPDSCEKYGRYYSHSIYGSYNCNDDDLKIQSICPNGWHLPNVNEWNGLSKSSNKDAKVLWEFGFGAIPAGELYVGEWNKGPISQDIASFISYPATYVGIGFGTSYLYVGEACQFNESSALGNGHSVRCVKDEE